MYDCYVTFRSITLAQTGATVLEKGAIRSRMIRSPKEISDRGCGYSLLVRSKDCVEAAHLLKKANIAGVKFYRVGDQSFSEVRLP